MPGGVFLVGRGPYLELHGPLRVVAWDVGEHSWFITLAGRIPPPTRQPSPAASFIPLGRQPNRRAPALRAAPVPQRGTGPGLSSLFTNCLEEVFSETALRASCARYKAVRLS